MIPLWQIYNADAITREDAAMRRELQRNNRILMKSIRNRFAELRARALENNENDGELTSPAAFRELGRLLGS